MKKIRFILLFFLFFTTLFANVDLKLPSNAIKDEAYIFSIEVQGEDVIFPKIEEISGFKVSTISNSSSTSIINSKISKKIKRVFSFYPTKDFIFPSLVFNIDNKEFRTQKKEVKLAMASKTNSSIFDFEISSNKQELYVGQPFELLIRFKHKLDIQILDLSFINPDFKNFWYKKLDYQKSYESNGFNITELKFLLFPQKDGVLQIEPLRIDAQYVDTSNSQISFFSNSISTKKIYSNFLDISVKALPNGVNLVGNFDIETKVSKQKVQALEAVIYTIKIEGNGNFEDIKDLNLDIKNAKIYSNKAQVQSKYIDGKYKGIYEKSYTIISNSSYTIPSFKFSYFNSDEERVINKETKSFEISVLEDESNLNLEKATLEKATNSVEKKQVEEIIVKSSFQGKILYFCLGIISTLLTLGLYYYVINSKKSKKLEDTPLIKKVKQSKTSNELLKVLSVYVNKNEELNRLIFKLENKNEDLDILKKEIIKLLKRVNLKGL
ncbi:BatD family protein [Arcobacter sp. YIC-464]|uniref:BatD family protein n=1 Tax=Arcobacter sp. YIC-464 TaxID=3376631 RepID=UPI003C19F6E3